MEYDTIQGRSGEILVVEDDPVIRQGYRKMIEKRGYAVACAPSTDEALRSARRRPPIFALLDIRLNKEANGGIAVAVAISKWYHAPHLYITAFGEEMDTIRAARQTSPVGILDKPAAEEAVLQKIEQGIRQREEEVRLRDQPFEQWVEEFYRQQASRPEEACERLIEELEQRSLDDDWIEDLVLLAEDTQFSPQQDARIAPRLLEAATVLRDNESAAYTTTVHSAIRTYASMAALERIGTMAELLSQPGEHAVDTVLVALKSLRRILEATPPGEALVEGVLTDKVVAVGRAYLNPWVLTPGTNAAVAQNAVLVLTALGHPQVIDFVADVRSRHLEWFELQLAARLRELQEHWRGMGNRGETYDPVQFAHQVLQHLEA
jgi:DNA-binding response OmpR family regulator